MPAGNPGTAAAQTTLGSAILGFFEIDSSFSWVWNGVGVLVGMSAFCAGVALVAYKYNSMKETPAVLSQQQEEEQQWQRKCIDGKHQKQLEELKDVAASQDCVAIELAAGGFSFISFDITVTNQQQGNM